MSNNTFIVGKRIKPEPVVSQEQMNHLKDSLGKYLEDISNDEITKGRMKITHKEVPRKSNHKHDYYPVLIIYKWDDHNHYSAGVKCNICGNVRSDEPLFNKLTNTTFPFLGFSDNSFVDEYRALEITEKN